MPFNCAGVRWGGIDEDRKEKERKASCPDRAHSSVTRTQLNGGIVQVPANILVVEDNDLARRNMVIFFKARGYEVLEAQRGEEAVRLIRDIDNFDVIITDLRMPGMIDGLEVLRIQNEVSPGTKTILVTGYGSNQIKNQAMSLGAAYFDKPVQFEQLLAHMRNVQSP